MHTGACLRLSSPLDSDSVVSGLGRLFERDSALALFLLRAVWIVKRAFVHRHRLVVLHDVFWRQSDRGGGSFQHEER